MDRNNEKQELNDEHLYIEKRNAQNLPSDLIRKEKFCILRSAVAVAVAFLLNFTAFTGMSNLQSSLHRDGGIGVISQCVLYVFFVLSSLFFANFVIGKIGYKWAMMSSIAGFITWTAANGYAVWGTMIPTCIIVGLSAGKIYFCWL